MVDVPDIVRFPSFKILQYMYHHPSHTVSLHPVDGPKSIVQGGWAPARAASADASGSAAVVAAPRAQVFGVWRLALLDVVRTRGVGGLYAGLPIMVARSFPAQGSLFLGYETAKGLLAQPAY